jgi:hypothetical protein
MPAWQQDAFLLIPRLICGYLLTSDFGAPKFGPPWSRLIITPIFLNLPFGSPTVLPNIAKSLKFFLYPLLGWTPLVKQWVAFFYCLVCNQGFFFSYSRYHAGSYPAIAMGQR